MKNLTFIRQSHNLLIYNIKDLLRKKSIRKKTKESFLEYINLYNKVIPTKIDLVDKENRNLYRLIYLLIILIITLLIY